MSDPLVEQVSEDEVNSLSSVSPPWSDHAYTAAGSGTETESWGVEAVNGKVFSGSTNRKIYIIDSGVALHDDLPQILRKNVACGSNTGNCSDTDPSTYPVVGCYAHATHVAGIIGALAGGDYKTTRGVYAGFPNLVSLSVLRRTGPDNCGSNEPGDFTVSAIGYALDYIYWDNANNNPNRTIHIATMSINTGGVQYLYGTAGPNWAKLKNLANGIWSNGVQIVPGVFFTQSAGNRPTQPLGCDAVYKPGYSMDAALPDDGIMVVGAVNSNGAPMTGSTYFGGSTPPTGEPSYATSNYGACLDIWAPGDIIVSTFGNHVMPTSVVGTNYTGTVGVGTQGWAILSGTSMAAPHVAAVAAWLADTYGVSTSGELETLVRNNSIQHNSATDPFGYPVKVPRLP